MFNLGFNKDFISFNYHLICTDKNTKSLFNSGSARIT